MIAIKDVEKPSDCWSCPLYFILSRKDAGYCYPSAKAIDFEKAKYEYTDCPIIDLQDGLYQVKGEKIWKYHGKGEKK